MSGSKKLFCYDALAIMTCKRYNYKYAVITPNDIVIPPKNDNISKD